MNKYGEFETIIINMYTHCNCDVYDVPVDLEIIYSSSLSCCPVQIQVFYNVSNLNVFNFLINIDFKEITFVFDVTLYLTSCYETRFIKCFIIYINLNKVNRVTILPTNRLFLYIILNQNIYSAFINKCVFTNDVFLCD